MLHCGDSRADGTVVVGVSGDVDSSNAGELRAALREIAAGEDVVIDLRAVPFMDSAGLGALICGIRELRMRQGNVALCVRRGAVLRLLSVTGFDRVVPAAQSVDQASAAIRKVRQQQGDSVSTAPTST